MSEGMRAPFFINGNKLFDAQTARSSWTQVQLRRTVRTSLLNAKEHLKAGFAREGTMYRFATILYVATMSAVIGGTALNTTPAEAAKAPSAEAAALKQATAACKAEAKEKKIGWPASRKFVSSCVEKTVKLTPAQLQEIAVRQAIVACKAEAKGKKIWWPASRKFVSTCLSNALKDYHLDVALLRRELNMAGLRKYTPQETGCMQNVYCED